MHTLPLVVVGGWLGAGKTTLVNHLLRHAGGRRIAVLVNDFGDVGIDADLIASSADASAGVLSLAGGCLCCSFGDDLVGTLAGLARREPPPDLALIELSGVALPDAVLRTARLCPAVQVVGTLVLADAGAVRRQAADRYVSDTVQQQLASADWLLLNKSDLVGADEARATLDWLAAQAPRARVWAGQADQVAPELVLGWPDNASPEPAPHDAAQAFGGRPIGAAGRASAIFESVTVELPPGVDLQALGAALADAGSGVLRAKALAADAQGQGRLLQVAGGRWAVTPVAAPSSGRLVMIGLRGRWDPQALRGRVGQP